MPEINLKNLKKAKNLAAVGAAGSAAATIAFWGALDAFQEKLAMQKKGTAFLDDNESIVVVVIILGILLVLADYGALRFNIFNKKLSEYKSAKNDLLGQVNDVIFPKKISKLNIEIVQKDPTPDFDIAKCAAELGSYADFNDSKAPLIYEINKTLSGNMENTKINIYSDGYKNQTEPKKVYEIFCMIKKNPGLVKLLKKKQMKIFKGKTNIGREEGNLYNDITKMAINGWRNSVGKRQK